MENFRLRVFRAVARHGNFRMAAEELLLTQPAVSQQIKALESELDTALFDRSGGKVALTAAGTALLPFADQLAALANRAREAVAAATSSSAGTLTLAASQTIGQYLLPRLIAGFLAENPRVRIEVLSGNTQQVLEDLTAHRAQLALIEGPALRQDVHLTPFMQDHMVCVVPSGHEWAGETISLAHLQQATFVTRELGSGSRRIVEAGLGIAFVSGWAIRSQLALGTLHLAHAKGLALGRDFALATPVGPAPTGLTGVFHRFVLERAEGLAPRPSGRPKSKST
jgi:DNA-binding transcriptional LysR family regulator